MMYRSARCLSVKPSVQPIWQNCPLREISSQRAVRWSDLSLVHGFLHVVKRLVIESDMTLSLSQTMRWLIKKNEFYSHSFLIPLKLRIWFEININSTSLDTYYFKEIDSIIQLSNLQKQLFFCAMIGFGTLSVFCSKIFPLLGPSIKYSLPSPLAFLIHSNTGMSSY